MAISKLLTIITKPVSIAPLVIFRIAFGALLFTSTFRFILKGWVYQLYVLPKMYFPYYGFEWVKPLSENGMYLIFGLMALNSILIIIGFFYRIAIALFFILFTYVELIDKTNYLNHYYFVSIVCFILIFVPAHKAFSVDNKLFKKPEINSVPNFFLLIIKLQLFLVYFFAGVSKINYDWLIEAQPLKLWLPAFSHFYIIGHYLENDWVAYLFCWFGCLYDLSIGFLLFNKRTINVAYILVLIFHLATALFFNIGMFPYVMIIITTIFFKEKTHKAILTKLKSILNYNSFKIHSEVLILKKPLIILFVIYFLIQIITPFRYLLYDGKLFWTEQGYRFSWRVMLMEKAGTAFFYIKDCRTNKQIEVDNKKHLTYMQEKQMATQPDMMIDYAKFLKQEYIKKGFLNPKVTAQSFVTLNGKGSKEFINDTLDLSLQTNSFLKNKNWIKKY